MPISTTSPKDVSLSSCPHLAHFVLSSSEIAISVYFCWRIFLKLLRLVSHQDKDAESSVSSVLGNFGQEDLQLS